MTQPFSAIVCQGKKVYLPEGKVDRCVQSQDRLTAQAKEAPPAPDSTLVGVPHSTLAARRQKMLSHTLNHQTQLPTAPLTFDIHFQKPSPPSPLVNIPLSGKRLPILYKIKNKTAFSSANGEVGHNSEVLKIDQYGGGDSTISSLMDKLFLQDKANLYDNTCSMPAPPKFALHFTTSTSPIATCTPTLTTCTSSVIAYTSTLAASPMITYTSPVTTYTSPLAMNTSPLKISSLDIQPKKTSKSSNYTPSATMTAKMAYVTTSGDKDYRETTFGDKDAYETATGDTEACETASGDKDERKTASGDKSNDCASKTDLETAQPYTVTLNIIGSKLKTPKRHFPCPKAEIPKGPKVKYYRGLTISGALYAFCCHLPYKGRLKGVVQNVSVCPQYSIYFNKKVSIKTQPKTEMLFKFPNEETTVKGKHMLTVASNSPMNYSVNTKPGKSLIENKKKENLNAERKKLKENSNGRRVTFSNPDLTCSQKAFQKIVPSHSSQSKRLSLRDDFPFHCYLLFQFEDRKKVRKRLNKLPERYELFLSKRHNKSLNVKSTHLYKDRNKLTRRVGANKSPKLSRQKRAENDKSGGNEVNNGTQFHAKLTPYTEEFVERRDVAEHELQNDQVAKMQILPKDNACDPSSGGSSEQHFVAVSRTLDNRKVIDSNWQKDDVNEYTSGGSVFSDDALNAIQERISATKVDTTHSDQYNISENVTDSGPNFDRASDHTSYIAQDGDHVECLETLDGELDEKEMCSEWPPNSKSILSINKFEEEQFIVGKNINEDIVSPGEETSSKINIRTQDVVDDVVNNDLSVDKSHSSDLISQANCSSNESCDFIPYNLLVGNDYALIPDVAITLLDDGKSRDDKYISTERNTLEFECIYPKCDTVLPNSKTDDSVSAQCVDKSKVLPLISFSKHKSTFTAPNILTQPCAQADVTRSLPIINEEMCSKNLVWNFPQQFNDSDSPKSCPKLRPKTSFIRTEPLALGEKLDSALPVKLPSATVCSESSSKKNMSRVFYSESPDSGISVNSRNSATVIATDILCQLQRNTVDVNSGVDIKMKTQELDLNTDTNHPLVNNKTLNKLDTKPYGSDVEANNCKSSVDSHFTYKDISAYVGSTILKKKTPHTRYPSLENNSILCHDIHVNKDKTHPRGCSTRNRIDQTISKKSAAFTTVPKFPVFSQSTLKELSATCRINRVELRTKESAVIPLPSVASDLKTRSSTAYGNGSKIHMGTNYASSYLKGK